jgi:Ca-activated chloride channel homolog
MVFERKIATILIMLHRTRALSILFILIAVQGRPAVQDSNSPLFSVSVDLVKVPVSVFDSQGNLVSNLRREDFRIWEDQALQQIRSFGIDRNPVSVVLLLDTSMSSKTEMKHIKQAAEEFAEALSPDDRISIIGFDDEVYRALDWTDDMKKVRRALGRLRSGVRTALYDAMFFAANDQLKNIDGRKAIILLTDCLNNESEVTFYDASLRIVQSQASLYVVSKTGLVIEAARKERRVLMIADMLKRLYGDGEDYIGEIFKNKEKEMTELSEKTGGRCFFPSGYDRLTNIYVDVARELKSKYYLTYVSNQKLKPNSYHRISIEYMEPTSKINYRKGYYYQPQFVSKAPS